MIRFLDNHILMFYNKVTKIPLSWNHSYTQHLGTFRNSLLNISSKNFENIYFFVCQFIGNFIKLSNSERKNSLCQFLSRHIPAPNLHVVELCSINIHRQNCFLQFSVNLVAEPTGSMPPRLAPTVLTVAYAERETDMHLTCSAQGNPAPSFR